MAGLALCISDLPEIAPLVQAYNLGLLVEGMEPQAIATAVNSLEPARVDQFKRNALEAARELNWENESRRMITAYELAICDKARLRSNN
jgi:glycosyltransferase involved in cell wall biosynthesis